MYRRSRPFPRSPNTFHRYLKPGALAQIRNSRFNRVKLVSQIYSTRSSSLSPPSPPIDSGMIQVNIVDASPCFAARVYGPLCLKRKKLLASKSSWFISSSPASLTPDSSPDPVVDGFGNGIGFLNL